MTNTNTTFSLIQSNLCGVFFPKDMITFILMVLVVNGGLIAQTVENSKSSIWVKVLDPAKHAVAMDAKVIINGQEAKRNEELLRFEGEGIEGEQISLQVEYPNARSLEMKVSPLPLGQVFTASLGPEGCTYLQTSRSDVISFQPDESRIGIVPKGTKEEDWEKSPELIEILEKLGLEIVPDYPIDPFQNMVSPVAKSPYLSLGKIGGGSLEGELGKISSQFQKAGYIPGIFLEKGNRNLYLFQGILYLTEYPSETQVRAMLATSNMNMVGVYPNHEIRFGADRTPDSISDWMKNLQSLWDQPFMKALGLESYTAASSLEH